MSAMTVRLPQGPPLEPIELPVGPGAPVTAELFQQFPPRTRVNIVGDTVFAGRDGGFDVADLDALTDDGWRHELIDGVIVMSPSPSHPHQRALTELSFALRGAVPEDLEVLVAPFDVRLGKRRQVQPDVIVVPKVNLGDDVPTPKLVSRCCPRPTGVTTSSPSGASTNRVTSSRTGSSIRTSRH